jgi:hypothetical protein
MCHCFNKFLQLLNLLNRALPVFEDDGGRVDDAGQRDGEQVLCEVIRHCQEEKFTKLGCYAFLGTIPMYTKTAKMYQITNKYTKWP